MTEIVINDITPRVGYTAAGGETGFEYPFPIFESGHLKVIKIDNDDVVSTLVEGSGYTVNGVGNAAGGSIDLVLPASATAGHRYVLYRDVTNERVTDFLQGGDFKAADINRELDLIRMELQERELESDRSAKLQKTDAQESILFKLESNADRQGKFVKFSADGTQIEAGPDAGDIADAADNAAIAVSAAADAEAAQAAAEDAQAAAEAAAASLDIPSIAGGDALKVLRVKSDETGLEFATNSGGGTGVLKDMNIGQGLEDDGSSNLRVKLDGSTIARSASGIKVADASIGATQLSSTAVTPGSYTAANITVDADGRITAASNGGGGLASVSQGDINSSTGAVSAAPSGDYGSSSNKMTLNTTPVTLPGGQYGFMVESKDCVATTSGGNTNTVSGWLIGNTSSSYVSKLIAVGHSAGSAPSGPTGTIYAQQRYVTASPPFDPFGEGEAAGFLFLLMNKDGSIAASYFADVPPWGYNGPTDIMAVLIDKRTGKKYRKKPENILDQIRKKGKSIGVREENYEKIFRRKFQDLGAPMLQKAKAELGAQSFKEKGAAISLEIQAAVQEQILAEHYEEITQEIKNRDMPLLPHPFEGHDPSQTVVLVGLYDDVLRDLIIAQNRKEDVMDAIVGKKRFILPENDFIKGKKKPKGVELVKLKIK